MSLIINSLATQISLDVKRLLKQPEGDRCRATFQLVKSVNEYIDRIQPKYLESYYFVFELKRHSQKLIENSPQYELHIRKIDEAARASFSLINQQTPALLKSEYSKEEITEFLRLPVNQLELSKLAKILTTYPVEPEKLNAIVKFMIHADVFHNISYPVIHFHMTRISLESRNLIALWIRNDIYPPYKKIGRSVEKLRQQMKGVALGVQEIPSKFRLESMLNTRKALHPLICELVLLLNEILQNPVNSYLHQAFRSVNEVAESWRDFKSPEEILERINVASKRLKQVPAGMSREVFQRKLEELMKTETPGAMDHLFVIRQMESLPEEFRFKLLRWADENDDFGLAGFLIQNQLVPDKWRDQVISNAISDHCHEEIYSAMAGDLPCLESPIL